MSPTVRYLDAEPNGLAQMLGALIEANLERRPDLGSRLRPAVIGISALDAGVAVSIRLGPGEVVVRNGLARGAQVVVGADSDTLVELSSVPLRLGLPDLTTPAGRAVVRKLLTGRLKVRGLLLHAGTVALLNELLSVS